MSPQETLQYWQVVLVQSPVRSLTAPFLWVLVPVRVYLGPPRLEALFSLVLWKSYNQILLAFKVRFPGDSQVRKPDLGSEPSQQWENLLVLLFFSLWVTYQRVWDMKQWLLLCLWTWVFFFWWVLVSSCRWLFNICLWFWCSHRRRWAHVLLRHLEPKVGEYSFLMQFVFKHRWSSFLLCLLFYCCLFPS